MIAIIDYGMGNLHSVENALRKLDVECKVTSDPQDLMLADKLILPGVGAFPDCMKNLAASGVLDTLKEEVLVKKKPLLGICLGMQALFEESEEGGLTKGLGFLKGRIVKMVDPKVKIPHIGWNLLEKQQDFALFERLSKHPFVYYVHSYYAQGIEESDLIGYSRYGKLKIPGLVCHENVLGAQFHPEKSAEDGLAILTYFKEEF
ncbi:imidazole glycerol phosphate synthase subunit HisH [[Eubacterium] hominis]|uniref:imidazole glycerol phosphate synthase subunit HisH n=1 Tax=[Eubacterium] hominis TaxID=2764325 RepID=UPI003A4E42A1